MNTLFNTVIPCTLFVFILAVVFGFLAYSRYLRHKETIALAEKGLAFPERRNGKDALRWGVIITAIGLALIIGLFPVALQGDWPLLLIGLLPTFFGLSLVLIYVLTRPEKPPEEPKAETEGLSQK
jgi:4-hydroxybenzoate polyprenyltransferase